MKRDFSEKAKEELLRLVKQVEDEQWFGFTDAIGDLWYGFEGLIGQLDVGKYVDNISKYHKKVIDKEDATAGDIEEIFKNVNLKDYNYQVRFAAQVTDLQSYRQLIQQMAGIIAPGKGDFTGEHVRNTLKASVGEYLKKSQVLQEIADDGLDSKEVEELNDPSLLQGLLERMSGFLIGMVPNVGVGQKYEIPFGPDMVFYYEVEVEGDLGGDVNIGMVLEDQRLKLDKISMETGGMLSIGGEVTMDGEGKIVIESESSSVEFNVDGSIQGSGSVKVGDNTYTITVVKTPTSIKLEESVSTEVDGCKVTTKIGFEKVDSNGNNWSPIPEPVPVEAPYPGYIPDFEVDWETVGTVVVVGTVIYTVVYVGAAIYTGGGSVVVLPPPIPA